MHLMRVFTLLWFAYFPLHATRDLPPLSSLSSAENTFFHTMVEGNNRFAFDLYQKARLKSGNLCFSPYGIVSGLAIAAVGAKGETAEQFQTLLHYSLSFLPLVSDLPAALQEASKIQIEWANAIWLQKNLPLLPSFKIALQRNFNLTPQFLDFAVEPTKSIEWVNHWTAQKTAKKIGRIVSGQDLNSTTRCVLTIANSINGEWEQGFNLKETKRLPFYLSAQRTALTEMMYQVADYSIWKGDEWDVLMLPYVSSHQTQLAMALLLPKEGMLEALEKNLTLANWKQWLKQVSKQKVALTLPRFRLEDRLELHTLLNSMGLTDAFNAKADFSGLTREQGFFINKVIHKTLVSVDERGGSNEAKTAVDENKLLEKDSPPYPFIANRPFIFLIWDQKTDSILWMGRLAFPYSS